LKQKHKGMEETFDIYDVVNAAADGRYFIIDTQVHSGEMYVDTKITFYPTFSTLLNLLYKLGKILLSKIL